LRTPQLKLDDDMDDARIASIIHLEGLWQTPRAALLSGIRQRWSPEAVMALTADRWQVAILELFGRALSAGSPRMLAGKDWHIAFPRQLHHP
jgi:hypothetical protein